MSSISMSRILNLTLSICLGLIGAQTLASSTPTKKTAALLDSKLAQGQPLGTDLEDLVKYTPGRVADALILARAFRAADSRIFHDAETLEGQANLEAAPTIKDGVAIYPIIALIRTGSKPADAVFRKLTVTVSGLPREITDIQLGEDVPLVSANFTVSVGLVSRLAVLEDIHNNLLIVFPIGVGGIDMGIIGKERHILTPMFHNALLRRQTVIPSLGVPQGQPAYYRNEPYMPITNSKGRLADVAFHITILSDSLWEKDGPNYLVRGFDSHGCMRLRLKDLQEFFAIVMNGGSDALPVDVDYFVSNKNSAGQPDQTNWNPINAVEPYPLRQDGYQQVKNFAAPGEAPHAQRDTDPNEPHHLILLQNVSGAPAFAKLDGFDGDDVEILSQFEAVVGKRPVPKASHKVRTLQVTATPPPAAVQIPQAN